MVQAQPVVIVNHLLATDCHRCLFCATGGGLHVLQHGVLSAVFRRSLMARF